MSCPSPPRSSGSASTGWRDYPTAGLAGLPERELSARIRVRVEQVDADALIVLDRSGVTGHPDHQAATAAALAAAAERGLPVLEWGMPAEVATALATEFGVTMQALAGGEQVTFRVDRARHREAIRAHVSQAPDNPLLRRRLELLGANETARLVRPPLTSQLPRFVAHAGRWARPDADPAERSQLLDALVGFATLSDVTTWPATLLADDPQRAYAAHCLHNDDNGWSLATIVTANGSATPPHDHQSRGAAATVAGAERNTRYSGVCPDRLRAVGQEIFPPGGGYLFGAGDIHQAADAAGRSVSVHLLVGSESHPIQRCPEPGTAA